MDGVIVDTEPVHPMLTSTIWGIKYCCNGGNVHFIYGFSTRNTFQNWKSCFVIEQEVEDLIQRKRNIFNDAFDSKADLNY
jgi:hypothetical protein